jgi:Flp pilus assembly protein TadG
VTPPTRDIHRILRAARSERGQSSVEFAMVLPLLVVIILGMVDFGFALNYWIDETHLASTAARYAAVSRNPSGTSFADFIRSQANTGELQNGGTQRTPTKLQVCVTYQNNQVNSVAGDWVKVEIKSDYHLLPVLKAGPMTITGSATMRLERKPDTVAIPEGGPGCP